MSASCPLYLTTTHPLEQRRFAIVGGKDNRVKLLVACLQLVHPVVVSNSDDASRSQQWHSLFLSQETSLQLVLQVAECHRAINASSRIGRSLEHIRTRPCHGLIRERREQRVRGGHVAPNRQRDETAARVLSGTIISSKVLVTLWAS